MNTSRRGFWTQLLLSIEVDEYRYMEVAETDILTVRRYLYGGGDRSKSLVGRTFTVNQFVAVPHCGDIHDVKILLKFTRTS